MGQTDAGQLQGEAPEDAGGGVIARRHPGRRLGVQGGPIRDAPLQTLPAEDRQLQFGHVEPTAMGGGVVPLQALGDATGFRRGKAR